MEKSFFVENLHQCTTIGVFSIVRCGRMALFLVPDLSLVKNSG
jgi:hypothetical protein